MTRKLLIAGILLVLLGGAGFLGAASGLIPIKASSGHFAITEWFLNFAKERSVATHTLGAPALDLRAPWLVVKGATHFETGCRPCHGAPDLARLPRVTRSALPAPPPLEADVAEWEPEELFYIVKHGIKFTGMPAWPAQARDDEVVAMVAFLLQLPKLDAEAYRRLAWGDAPEASPADGLSELMGEPPPRSVVSNCARCHGSRGEGRGSAAFPILTGQRRGYLELALRAYANDDRQSGIMQTVAAALGEEDMAELAGYYSRQRAPAPKPREPAPDRDAIERGRALAEHGAPERRLPSCVDCHGPAPGPRHPATPILAGQFADYIVLQLELFARGVRGGSERAQLMDEVAPRLSAAEMRDVAAYYSSLEPERDAVK